MENTQCNQSQKKQNKKHPSKAMALFRVLRRQRKIPIENLVEFMEKHNYHISKKAIYGWECGSSNPDLQAFFLMCQFYGIDNVSLFFDAGNSIPQKNTEFSGPLYLSDHETEILKQYRNSPIYQPAVDKLLGIKNNF